MSANSMTFLLITPAGVAYRDDTVLQVTVPTTTGEITILPNHIPLMSLLAAGELRIKKNDHEVVLAIASGGVVEVQKNNIVRVLAETAERAEHIDIAAAEAAKKRAEELLKQAQFADDREFAAIQASIEREVAKIRVGRKYRKLPPA